MKLIQTKDYLLLVDEEAEIKEEKLVVRVYEDDIRVAKSLPNSDNLKRLKDKRVFLLIAYHPLNSEAKELDLPLLPNPFEETDIRSIAFKEYPATQEPNSAYYRDAFVKGYKLAQSKQFSLEDMKKAIKMAREQDCSNFEYYGFCEKAYTDDEIIQSLSTQQLPKEFIPEYEYVESVDELWEFQDDDSLPKRKIKTITNSKGKQELVGKWRLPLTEKEV